MRLLFIFAFFQLTFSAFGQTGITYYFHADKTTVKYKIVADSTGGKRYKERAYSELSLNGYTGLYLKDSVQKNNTIHYYLGYANRFDKIELVNADLENSRKNRTTTKTYESTLFFLNKKITDLENNGYPFAQIKINQQAEQKNKLTLTYQIDSGQFFIIDKITIKSKEKFHEPTLLSLINLEPGEVYNESRIVATGELLEVSRLYKLMRPVEVVFRNGKAELFIYIEKENSSDADGYVGFQQDKITEKLALNGYINLSLINAFNRSETFLINWKNNPDKTQNLNIRFEYPYILNTPVGIGTRINLQKQDSSFVRADSHFEISYLQPYYRFSVFYLLENSTTLLTQAVADFRDYKKNTLGLSVKLNPKMPPMLKFYHPELKFNGGFFNYRADSIETDTKYKSNTKYAVRYQHVIDFLKYFHLNNAIQFEGLTAQNQLSRNELIFFGGLRSLRGFYELELTGNDVVIINNEIEFAPVSAISFKILYDYGSWQNAGWKSAHAAGFGFAFSTGAIKLELILANGWFSNTSPDLTSSKIHLGFKSSF